MFEDVLRCFVLFLRRPGRFSLRSLVTGLIMEGFSLPNPKHKRKIFPSTDDPRTKQRPSSRALSERLQAAAILRVDFFLNL